MTLLKEENAQSKFNPGSYVETCLYISMLVLTSLLLKKPNIWMLKLSIHWVLYKARLHEKHRFQDQAYKYIIFKVCGALLLLSISMLVQHRELLGSSQFLEMMVRHNVISGMQIHWTKKNASALKQKVEYSF